MIVRSTSNGIQVVVYKSNALLEAQRREVKIKKRRKITKLGIICLVLVFISGMNIAAYSYFTRNKKNTPSSNASQTIIEPVVDSMPETTTPNPTATSKSTINTQNDQASLTYIVNKKNAFNNSYAPTDLREFQGIKLRNHAMDALENLMKAATAEDYLIRLLSGYRAYDDQIWTYQQYVNEFGQEKADTFSARPGYSEHQSGLAVDIGAKNTTCDLEVCFASTLLGLWLKDNAYQYGFILRYPEGKESITGYQYEPWHFRYVGVDAAKAITESGKTMDQYYGVDAGSY